MWVIGNYNLPKVLASHRLNGIAVQRAEAFWRRVERIREIVSMRRKPISTPLLAGFRHKIRVGRYGLSLKVRVLSDPIRGSVAQWQSTPSKSSSVGFVDGAGRQRWVINSCKESVFLWEDRGFESLHTRKSVWRSGLTQKKRSHFDTFIRIPKEHTAGRSEWVLAS